MEKLYSTLYKSVLRSVNDLVKDIQSTTPSQADIQVWSWENRVDEDKMPRVPLIGLNGLHLHENGGLLIISFGITLSTVDDANLHDEADVIDVIHKHFGEHKKVLLRDPDTGDVFNELVSVDCEVMPMGQTQMRNYRPIGIEVRRTGT